MVHGILTRSDHDRHPVPRPSVELDDAVLLPRDLLSGALFCAGRHWLVEE